MQVKYPNFGFSLIWLIFVEIRLVYEIVLLRIATFLFSLYYYLRPSSRFGVNNYFKRRHHENILTLDSLKRVRLELRRWTTNVIYRNYMDSKCCGRRSPMKTSGILHSYHLNHSVGKLFFQVAIFFFVLWSARQIVIIDLIG